MITLAIVLATYATVATFLGAVYAVAYSGERVRRVRAELRAEVAVETAASVRGGVR